MPITTRRGDDGTTEARGQTLPKDDPLFDALGDLDELQAFLSKAAHTARVERTRCLLEAAMAGLSRVMAALASSRHEDLGPELRREFESAIADYESLLGLSGFVLPGRKKASADLDVCRTVCRRAERSVVSLRDRARPEIMRFLNRLSDWLFLAARAEELSRRGRKKIISK